MKDREYLRHIPGRAQRISFAPPFLGVSNDKKNLIIINLQTLSAMIIQRQLFHSFFFKTGRMAKGSAPSRQHV